MLTGRKVPFTLAFAVLVALAFGVSCHGFFVDPTLTSLAITPATPTISAQAPGNTQQFSAVGVFNDGSSGSTPVSWSSSDASTVASINSSTGLATAIAVGTTTITATSTKLPTITATTQLTVVPGNVTSITVTPSNQSRTSAAGFTLTAKDQGGNDISSSVTWTFTVQGTGTVETGITGAAGSSGGEDFTVGTLSPSVSFPVNLSAVASLTVSGKTVSSTAVLVTLTS
jgi:hypothetical protein